MTYDKDYYQNKKHELNQKLAKKKDQTIFQITNLMNSFWEDTRDIQERYTELEKQESNSIKKDGGNKS